MLTVKSRQQRQLTMPPYKPEEKDQFHEFAEATPAPASVAAGSAAVAGASHQGFGLMHDGAAAQSAEARRTWCDAESVGALSDELNRMLRMSFAFLSSKTPASYPRLSLLTPS
jgi:hypothetical protein